MIIQVEYNRLEKIAQRFDDTSTVVKDMLTALEDLVDNLQRGQHWVADSADDYYSVMRTDILPTTQRLENALAETGVVLREIIHIFNEAEESAEAELKIGDAGIDLMAEMRRNARSDIIAEIREDLDFDPSLLWVIAPGAALTKEMLDKVDAYKDFYNQVHDGATWDHKNYVSENLGGKIELVAGLEVDFDVYSNIHYGFIGRSAGFDSNILLGGAGAQQIISAMKPDSKTETHLEWAPDFFDDPRDQAAIRIGMELYDTYGEDFTTDNFIEVYQKYHDKL